MARRRLSLTPMEPAAGPAPATSPIAPPIAQVAREAATEAALRDLAETLRTAREGGSLVLDLALPEIDERHLARDRLPVPGEDEELASLKASLAAHGQRMPIEVMRLENRPHPYGLLSGLRRLTALRELHAETGEARFATVRALIRRPESPAAAYLAMVEENEIRSGLSYYERARLAALTADMGVFESERAALLGLFGAASRARRSKIGSFIAIYRALGGSLRFPTALPERLGLKLAEALKMHGAEPFLAALEEGEPASPAEEQAALAAALRRAAAKPPSPGEALTIRPGLTLSARRSGQRLLLRLEGEEVTETLRERAVALLAQHLARA